MSTKTDKTMAGVLAALPLIFLIHLPSRVLAQDTTVT